jgi:uncharacterized protein YbaR (Trm112 family)
MSTLPTDLVRILRCPKCRHAVAEEGDHLVCQHPVCALRYPVRNGIPVMLSELAEPPQPANRTPPTRS